MGSRFGRIRAATDPFYTPVPPPTAYQTVYDPSGGLGAYDPSGGYEYVPTRTMGNLYRGSVVPQPSRYGGLYAQGLNQIPGAPPWNYGNYYLGNTTMQMMPNMVANFYCVPQSSNMPSMPCCMPQSYSMPMNAPMVAAATALPIAFNPLVQGMYPSASMNPVNWMTPSSFMSALTSGPMPYRPPAYQFPSNVGMVMTIPYGTPNPLISAPAYNMRTPSYSYAPQSSCCSYYQCCPPSSPSAMSPPVTYYPHPVSVPQQYPVPYAAPFPIPNIQQVPVVRPIPVIAPPVVANIQQPLPLPYTEALQPSQGAYTNGVIAQPTVLTSHYDASQNLSTFNESTRGTLPVYNPSDRSNSLIGQPILSSFSSISSDRYRRYLPSIPRSSFTHNDIYSTMPRSDPIIPPILYGELISDSGWLPKDTELPMYPAILGKKKHKKRPSFGNETFKPLTNTNSHRVSFLTRRRRHHSGSSASEYDCTICQEQRGKSRLRKYYGSSTLSSLLSSAKNAGHRLLSSNDSVPSSALYSPPTLEKEDYKSHTRNSISKRSKKKSSSSDRSTSPILLRKSSLRNSRQNMTIHEVDEEQEQEQEQEKPETKLSDDNDSSLEKSEQQTSQISLLSKDE
ncbi:unnamed protein product [Adineta ricciae]|uniref:Uncharacterized protein n=1 Tax=Adineta ricciae TaxID=249248 RepID=A0A813QCA0_ADIRI|nr:unnamed protein product [Adineta ricciae]CAF1253830.1 unnamed protein product [Adineta ricciae]